MTHGPIRLAAFDMDGTVLEPETSWVAIHRKFGTEASGEASLKLYSEGKIDYLEFMRRDIASWPKGVTRGDLDKILSGYTLRADAAPTLTKIRERGIKTALVTSGIDILASKVAADLKIDHWVANGLNFDAQGRVLPEGVGRVDPTRKDLAYLRLLSSVGIDSQETIAVGDTVYDLAFLKSARKGFMLAHTTRVQDEGVIHIGSLTEILDHL